MKKLVVTLIIVLVIFLLGIFWWQNGIFPVNKDDTSSKIFVVHKGEGVRATANNLKSHKLIRDPIVFFLLTKQSGLDKKIQAGDFRLSPSMSADKIAQALTHGTLDIWITIPEGQRAGQIAEALKNNMPKYEASWDSQLEENEGYLFPDTYLFPKDSDITTIISIMKGNFDNKFKEVDLSKTKLSKQDLVILASLIEREARHDKDRNLVSSVIHNRLNAGMKLDIDATIQYAKGKIDGKWWRTITRDDYSFRSAYNTYLVAGLPPTPISNPGLLTLVAAANPAKTDYFFYFTDKNGVNHYYKTLDEQTAGIKKYGL